MIVSNQAIGKAIDQQIMTMPQLQNVSRSNSKQSSFITNSHKINNTINKFSSQTHHTLQCMTEINDFKHKVNMVLQSQAFPSAIQSKHDVKKQVKMGTSTNPSSIFN